MKIVNINITVLRRTYFVLLFLFI